MKDMLMKKLMKSEASEMPKSEKMGKMAALKELIQEMSALMGSDLENPMEEMQKVTVAAPDKESLMKGLDKAEDVLEEMPMDGFGKDAAAQEVEDEEEDMF